MFEVGDAVILNLDACRKVSASCNIVCKKDVTVFSNGGYWYKEGKQYVVKEYKQGFVTILDPETGRVCGTPTYSWRWELAEDLKIEDFL